jgi:hypothetical protein
MTAKTAIFKPEKMIFSVKSCPGPSQDENNSTTEPMDIQMATSGGVKRYGRMGIAPPIMSTGRQRSHQPRPGG